MTLGQPAKKMLEDGQNLFKKAYDKLVSQKTRKQDLDTLSQWFCLLFEDNKQNGTKFAKYGFKVLRKITTFSLFKI